MSLWAYLFLLIASLAVARSLSSALFLQYFDGRGLAVIYVVAGAAVAVAVALVEWLGRSTDAIRAALRTLLSVQGVGAILLIAATTTSLGYHPMIRAFLYVFVESAAFATTIQFWAIANSTLSLAQARRWYVLVGAGGILGSVFGGVLVRYCVRGQIVRAASVLAILAPLQVTAFLIFARSARLIARRAPKLAGAWNLDHAASSVGLQTPSAISAIHLPVPSNRPEIQQLPEPSSTLSFSLGMAGLLTVFSTTLIDFHFKLLADRTFAGDVGRSMSFFGGFFICVGVATLLVQLVVTPWIIRRGSAFAGLLASPATLMAMTLVNLLTPGLFAATLFKLLDSALNHSVYRSCQEMLYTPLPTHWVGRLKSATEGVYGRYGLMLAGAFLFLIAPLLDSAGPMWLLPWILGSMGAWLLSLYFLREEYVRAGNSSAATSERTLQESAT